MPHYYFFRVNVIYIGSEPPDPDVGGAFVNCLVESPDPASATEKLITALREDGWYYEEVDEVMDLGEAIDRWGSRELVPGFDYLDPSEPVSYGAFHTYPRN